MPACKVLRSSDDPVKITPETAAELVAAGVIKYIAVGVFEMVDEFAFWRILKYR